METIPVHYILANKKYFHRNMVQLKAYNMVWNPESTRKLLTNCNGRGRDETLS